MHIYVGMYDGLGEFFVSFCNCLLIKKKRGNKFLYHCYQFGNAGSNNSQLLLPVEHCRGFSIQSSSELDYHVEGVVLHQSFCRDAFELGLSLFVLSRSIEMHRKTVHFCEYL